MIHESPISSGRGKLYCKSLLHINNSLVNFLLPPLLFEFACENNTCVLRTVLLCTVGN